MFVKYSGRQPLRQIGFGNCLKSILEMERETGIALIYIFVAVFIGIPIWLETTSVYRTESALD